MNLITSILLVTSLLSCNCVIEKQSEAGLKVKPELRGCFRLARNEDPSLVNNDSIIYFLVDIKLINMSDRLIKFVTYTCTSVGNIVLDNRQIRVCVNDCSGNGPTIIVLKPKQEFSLPVLLQTNIKNAYSKIRVGWIFLDPNSERIKSFYSISKLLTDRRENLKNVIWSDQVFLGGTGGIPYEIH
jgi:hypothetical protein